MQKEIQIPSKVTIDSNAPKSALEELMEKAIRAKLAEFEARLSLVEANAGKSIEEFETVKGKAETLEGQNAEFYMGAYKKLIELHDKLDSVTIEVKSIEGKISTETQSIEKLREQEYNSIQAIKKQEAQLKSTVIKLQKQVKKQLLADAKSVKELSALAKKIFSDKNIESLTGKVKEQLVNRKFREEIIASMKKDAVTWKKLTGSISEEARKHATRKVAIFAAKKATGKLLAEAAPALRNVARKAARKTAESKAQEVAKIQAKTTAKKTAKSVAKKEVKENK